MTTELKWEDCGCGCGEKFLRVGGVEIWVRRSIATSDRENPLFLNTRHGLMGEELGNCATFEEANVVARARIDRVLKDRYRGMISAQVEYRQVFGKHLFDSTR